MANLIYRTSLTPTVPSASSVKSAGLFNSEIDGNFKSLDQSKLEVSNAVSTNTPDTVVKRDSNGDFTAGTVSAALSGNASTASTLQTGRTLTVGLTGRTFDGSADLSWSLAEIGAISPAEVTTLVNGVAALVDDTPNNTPDTIVGRDGSGNFAAGTITAALDGNASSATVLETSRTITIGDTDRSFDGSGNISWTRADIGADDAANLTTGTVDPARLGSGTADSTTFLRGDNTWQDVLTLGHTAGDTAIGFLSYAGTTKTDGQLYGGTTAPSATTRLNYDGHLYATGFYGDGSSLTNLTSANINGQVASALVAETVTVADQPAITSLGSLTSLDVAGGSLLQQTQERFVTIGGATGTVVHNFSSGGVFIHSSIAANFTANITNLPSSVGRTSIITLILEQGATARFCNGLSIGGSAQTIRWLGGTVPTPTGNAVDVQVFTIFQTGVSTYIVLGQLGTYN